MWPRQTYLTHTRPNTHQRFSYSCINPIRRKVQFQIFIPWWHVVACPTAAKVIRWWHVYWDPWHFFPETVKFCRPEGYKRKDGNPGGLARMTTTATATLAVTGKQGRRGTGMGFQTSSVSAALHLGGHSPLPVQCNPTFLYRKSMLPAIYTYIEAMPILVNTRQDYVSRNSDPKQVRLIQSLSIILLSARRCPGFEATLVHLNFLNSRVLESCFLLEPQVQGNILVVSYSIQRNSGISAAQSRRLRTNLSMCISKTLETMIH